MKRMMFRNMNMAVPKELSTKWATEALNKKYALYIVAGKNKDLYLRFGEDKDGNVCYYSAITKDIVKYSDLELEGIVGTAKDIEELVIILDKE